MTVAQATPLVSFVGTGGSNSFPFSFPVFLQSQLLVQVTSNLNPAVTYTLVLGTDYTIQGLNPAGTPASSGSITLVNNGQTWLTGGNLLTGYVLTIQANLPIAQTSSIRNQGDFDRGFLEDALDKVVMIEQQLKLAISQLNSLTALQGLTVVQGDITVQNVGSGLLVPDANGSGKVFRILVNNGQVGSQEVI